MSFCEGSSGDVVKRRLFSQAIHYVTFAEILTAKSLLRGCLTPVLQGGYGSHICVAGIMSLAKLTKSPLHDGASAHGSFIIFSFSFATQAEDGEPVVILWMRKAWCCRGYCQFAVWCIFWEDNNNTKKLWGSFNCLIRKNCVHSSRKYPYSPRESFCFAPTPTPDKKFQFLASYFAYKILAFQNPSP